MVAEGLKTFGPQITEKAGDLATKMVDKIKTKLSKDGTVEQSVDEPQGVKRQPLRDVVRQFSSKFSLKDENEGEEEAESSKVASDKAKKKKKAKSSEGSNEQEEDSEEDLEVEEIEAQARSDPSDLSKGSVDRVQIVETSKKSKETEKEH